MLRIIVQILGVLVLLLLLTIVTKRAQYSDHDGPSILFPGGALVSGTLHTGPEPDWSITEDEFTIKLQTSNPISSRRKLPDFVCSAGLNMGVGSSVCSAVFRFG